MKIGKTADLTQTDAIARTGQAAAQATGKLSGRAGAGEIRAADSVDKVQLSQTSRNLAAEAAAGGDAVRADKVNEVREAISKGEFHVSAKVVADKMIAQAAELIETLAVPSK
ncbi:MAG: flagellar biosynthesis anti-sigma factor FlgM [Burkholderiales bacterium]|nr:flagellar biosynthesis anti-sigma factor FlgM [Burkholderiales bacterium]